MRIVIAYRSYLSLYASQSITNKMLKVRLKVTVAIRANCITGVNC